MIETQKPHIYLVGAGGVGMVWIADYALQMGWDVSGSDASFSPNVARLQALGANIHIGSDPEKIPTTVTEAVMTAAATPNSPSFAEVETLRNRGISIVKRSEWIGKLTREKFTICISGAHGKTTTTAMVGWILDQAGLDPTVFVGGNIRAWNNTTKIGQSKYLVLEADEYDRSFHRFTPQMAVILNIDLDHTDYYTKGLPEIEQSYKRFLRNLPGKTGLVVAYGRDARIRKVCKSFSYKFRWYDEFHLWPGVTVPQPGLHNLLNATAAARIAHELGISHDLIKKALNSFPGVGRRFEYLGIWNKAELYDDYAHHPREIQALMKGVREKFPTEHVTVIFQPHQKARTQALLKDFARAFDDPAPTELVLAPIFHVPGREDDIDVTIDDVAKEIETGKHSFKLTTLHTLDEVGEYVKEVSKVSGVIINVGAGSISNLLEKWRQ